MCKPKIEINHVGLSVKDIDKAIEFYTSVMGWELIGGPFTIKNDGGSTGITNTLYGYNGHTWTSFRLAHILADNGVGLELLEFEGGFDPEGLDEFNFKQHGVFHFAITVPDTHAFAEKVKEWGGKEICDYNERPMGDVATSTVYLKDPCGIIFEVHNKNYEFLNRLPKEIMEKLRAMAAAQKAGQK
jgi:catechol 2,3-dioxygenase-like lactoylglutathione lyase family enzyme